MRTVTAAVVREKSGIFHIEALAMDEPREHEVLVSIRGSGICHTDLSARDQLLPFRLPAVLGHEGSGVVESVGSAVTRVRPGDHVVLSFAFCNACAHCRDQRVAYCDRAGRLNFGGVRADGSSVLRDRHGAPVSAMFVGQSSFSSHALVDESSVVGIRNDVPLELMGPLGCGMQTGAGTVINVLRPRSGSSIAIFGAGSVGLAALMAACIAGCEKIIAVDLNQARLQLARDLGATDTFNAAAVDAVEAIRSITRGRGVDYTIECTGQASVLRQAVDALDVCGTCALVGVADAKADAHISMSVMLRGRSLRGVTEGDCFPDRFIPQLVDWWREGRFPFDRLVRYFDLTQINKAMDACSGGSVIKPILRPVAPATL